MIQPKEGIISYEVHISSHIIEMKTPLMAKTLFSILFITHSILNLCAQATTLDDYIDIAIKENLSIKKDFLHVEKSNAQIIQANKLWNPQIDLNSSYLFARGGRVLSFPIGDLFNPTYEALNAISGTQSFPTNLENERIQLTPNNFLDAQLSISKPLVNSNLKYNQLIKQELAKLNALDQVITKREIIYQVKTAYYNILKSHHGKKIIQQNKGLLSELLEFNKTLVKYDKATENVITEVEFQLSTLQKELALIEEQQKLAESYFNLLLNRDFNEVITIDTTLSERLERKISAIEQLQEEAANTRIEFDQIAAGQHINDLNIERISKNKNPNLGVTAGLGYQAEDFDFDLGGPLYTLGFGLSWNIIDGGLRKQRIQELKIDKEILDNNKAQLTQKIELDVLQAYLGLNSLQAQLNAQSSAIKNAQQSYDIIKSKYDNNNALLIELLQAQNQLSTAKLSKVILAHDYLSQLAKLDKELSR